MNYTPVANFQEPVAAAPAGAFLIDEVGQNAEVAYSTRKLRSAYTGDAVEVRRSSDNTTTNIGFDSNGDLDTGALLSFVGSGIGTVKTWYDQSGNGHDGTSGGTAALEPIIASGSSAIFDDGPGLHPMLQSNFDRYINTPVFTAIYAPEMSGYTEALAYNGLSMFQAELSNGYTLGSYNNLGNQAIGMQGSAGGASNIFNWSIINTGTSGDPFLWSVYYARNAGTNAGKAWAWSHGGLITNNQIDFTLPAGVYNAGTCDQMTLFRYPADPLRMSVRIGEWIIWEVTSGLSDSERDTLQQNQGSYWGITTNNVI